MIEDCATLTKSFRCFASDFREPRSDWLPSSNRSIFHPGTILNSILFSDDQPSNRKRTRWLSSDLGCGRVEMWRGGVRFEHICSRLFHLAVSYWFDHGSVSTSRSSNGTCSSPASGSRTRSRAFLRSPASDNVRDWRALRPV